MRYCVVIQTKIIKIFHIIKSYPCDL